MQQLVAYTIIGLTTGAIYAVASSGLVVTYVTSGVFNIAHGAIGMIAAFCYWQVRFDWGWPAPLALLAILGIVCPLLGVAIDRITLRGMGTASEVTRLTVTVALMAAFIGLATWIWPPKNRALFRGFYDGHKVNIAGVYVSWHKIIAFICAIVVAIVLRILLYRTRLGVQMRAVVDDRSLAELNGARPATIASFAWAMGASLAGLAGILLAAEVNLSIIPLTLLVINAYAAAILGRLKSLPLTFLGAMLLGLADSYLVWGQTREWFPKSFYGFDTGGLRQAVPTIFLFIMLIALPQAKLRAGAARIREYSPVPQWRTSIVGAVLVVVGTIAVTGMMTRADQFYVVNTLVLSLAILSLVPLTGYAGLVSLAPMTFAGLGAVFMSTLPGNGNVFTLLLTVALVSMIGAIVALPALRLEGIYLALATGAFALVVSILIFNQSKVFPNGSADVPPLRIPGIDLSQPRTKAIGLSVAFALVALLVVALRRSKLGRQFVAMKDSQLAGATLGMNLLYTKTIAFAISAAIASLAGALDAGKVPTDYYTFDRSLPVLLLAIAGGISSVGGAFFGGFLLGGNSVLSTVVPSLTNISKVTPGLIGLSLGRNPNGASHQMAESFRPVTDDDQSLAIAVSGGLAIWVLEAKFGFVSHWGFFALIAVWGLGCVPNLPLITKQRGNDLYTSLVIAAVGLGVASKIDSILGFAPTGGRVLATIVLFVGTGASIQRAGTPRIVRDVQERTSPDLAGIDRDFTPEEITAADREVGVVL